MDIHLNTKLIASLGSVVFIPAAEIKAMTGISNATWYRIKQTPSAITIQQLLAISNGLHIPVRRIFSTEQIDVVGLREDYITEPYEACYYDDAALQKLVETNTDATWKRAAAATGMSYSRLRNSLLAITRTPVTRFLTVCNAFSIDPFTILIDPNPEILNRQKVKNPSTGNMKQEISSLRENVKALAAAVADLTEKYETLLQAYESLMHRTNVSIDTINGGHFDIAADMRDPR